MTLQKIGLALLAAIAVGVLVFLLRQTQESGGDVERYNGGQARLQSLSQLEAQLSQDVASARFALDAESVDLAQTLSELEKSLVGLQGASLLEGTGPAVDRALQAYVKQASAKLQLGKEYEASLKIVVRHFQEMRLAGNELLGTNSQLGPEMRQRVMSLITEVTTYGIVSAPTNGAVIDGLATEIEGVQNAMGESPGRDALGRLLTAAAEVRAAKDSSQVLMQNLRATTSAAALDTLATAFADDYRVRLQTDRRYRRMLAIYTVVLLTALGLMGLRLRRSFRELDGLNAELQNANVNLEQLVESRTGDLRKALEELRLQQSQLIQSEKMASLGQMVAGVAHEINTPLGYARSNVETVHESLEGLAALIAEYEAALQDLTSPEHNAEDLRRSAQRLRESRQGMDSKDSLTEFGALLSDAEHGLSQISELVSSLKNFSRVDRSHTELFDLNEGLETALKICQNHLKNRIEIERDYDTRLPRIPCAPSQINQVFLNILTNAAQAVEGQGRIRIRTRETGDRVLISIRDSGCGMDEQTRAHIFEPFFTTKEIGSGTGLGLSIVFRIIEDHGGDIRVASAPGKGSEFTIVLPKQPKNARSTAAPAVEAVLA